MPIRAVLDDVSVKATSLGCVEADALMNTAGDGEHDAAQRTCREVCGVVMLVPDATGSAEKTGQSAVAFTPVVNDDVANTGIVEQGCATFARCENIDRSTSCELANERRGEDNVS